MQNRTKACGYVRSSTEGDDIKIQKERLLELAEQKGYEIVEWYSDEGRSGSKGTEKRPGWTKLLSDAPNAAWMVVLCLDLWRFGRLNGVESAFAKQTLREAGKKLHTAVEGLVDWDTSMDRILDAVWAETSHQHSVQMAHATLNGKLRAFKGGRSIVGSCPYGFACRITDPQGIERSIGRTENFRVPKGWSKILVPGEPDEVEVVQWLFKTFTEQDVSFRWLAAQLNERGVRSPSGQRWLASTVVHLLANDTYVGDTRFGRRGSGKFVRLDGDKVVKADRDVPKEQQEGLVRQNTHEGIISRELWERVQVKLEKRSE